LNFRIGYDRGTGWSGYLEGRNLFDTSSTRIASAKCADISTTEAVIAIYKRGILLWKPINR
jgi:iron complex outermembrane receptor protein